MTGEHRILVAAVLALALVGAAVFGAAGDDVSTQDGGHDHSDDSGDDGSFLPSPGPALVLAAVGLAALALRRRG